MQAHGGSILKVGNLFYWYGENKEKTTGTNGIWHWGVRCYSSSDLYNWDDCGVIIPPVTDDPKSPLNPSKAMDRPHILFNRASGKFVCWIKVMENPYQTRAVLVADAITGPYRIVAQGILPVGMSAGDFDLVTSPDDDKAYMYFERVHSEMICADLTRDYTDFTGYYSTHMPHAGPPSVREAPAWFRRKGKQYLATSGTTGYFPNPSEIAMADTFHGPWTTLGDLHPSDRSRTSFNSQISSIFRHPAKKDLYIALGDRWLPNLAGPAFDDGSMSKDMDSGLTKVMRDRTAKLSAGERTALMSMMNTEKTNTSIARYVWLPIRFDGERPVIEWHDEWSLDDFA
ncbi:family 43 glycosylhydrolase [Novosphingobium sp. BL-8A]|uniref:family 43 glycosylhydrolase n=1 Tax=Novosphingobium sp. BL-8A TaxID=3127639 RepID=UPI0037570B3C